MNKEERGRKKEIYMFSFFFFIHKGVKEMNLINKINNNNNNKGTYYNKTKDEKRKEEEEEGWEKKRKR